MTATDTIRAMLDERGVEYEVINGYGEYIWEFGETGCARASRIGTQGLVQMIVTGVTPKQAIEATLGRGECHNVEEHPFMWSFTCSECGVHSITEGRGFNYCPNCGRKVRA